MAENSRDIPSDTFNPSLDFTSEGFDPLKALRMDESLLSLPCPDVSPCYSLIHYKEILRRQRRPDASSNITKESAAKGKTDIVTEEEKEKTYKPAPVKAIKSILTFMPEQTKGPLSMLQVAMTDKQVLNVWIRHSAGLRGVCTGKIRAFDRHWNIVMYDVKECYNPIRTVSNGGREKKRRKRIRQRKGKLGKGQDDLLNPDESSNKFDEIDSKSEQTTPNKSADSDTISINTTNIPVSGEQRVYTRLESSYGPETVTSATPTDPTTQPHDGRNLKQAEELSEQSDCIAQPITVLCNNPSSTPNTCDSGSNTAVSPHVDECGNDHQLEVISPGMYGQSSIQNNWTCVRRVKQLFIRGDNIAIITVNNNNCK